MVPFNINDRTLKEISDDELKKVSEGLFIFAEFLPYKFNGIPIKHLPVEKLIIAAKYLEKIAKARVKHKAVKVIVKANHEDNHDEDDVVTEKIGEVSEDSSKEEYNSSKHEMKNSSNDQEDETVEEDVSDNTIDVGLEENSMIQKENEDFADSDVASNESAEDTKTDSDDVISDEESEVDVKEIRMKKIYVNVEKLESLGNKRERSKKDVINNPTKKSRSSAPKKSKKLSAQKKDESVVEEFLETSNANVTVKAAENVIASSTVAFEDTVNEVIEDEIANSNVVFESVKEVVENSVEEDNESIISKDNPKAAVNLLNQEDILSDGCLEKDVVQDQNEDVEKIDNKQIEREKLEKIFDSEEVDYK